MISELNTIHNRTTTPGAFTPTSFTRTLQRSTSRNTLLRTLQHSIRSLGLGVTSTGVPPACLQTIASPHVHAIVTRLGCHLPVGHSFIIDDKALAHDHSRRCPRNHPNTKEYQSSCRPRVSRGRQSRLLGFVTMSQPSPSRRIDESNRDIAPARFGVSIVGHRRGIGKQRCRSVRFRERAESRIQSLSNPQSHRSTNRVILVHQRFAEQMTRHVFGRQQIRARLREKLRSEIEPCVHVSLCRVTGRITRARERLSTSKTTTQRLVVDPLVTRRLQLRTMEQVKQTVTSGNRTLVVEVHSNVPVTARLHQCEHRHAQSRSYLIQSSGWIGYR